MQGCQSIVYAYKSHSWEGDSTDCYIFVKYRENCLYYDSNKTELIS